MPSLPDETRFTEGEMDFLTKQRVRAVEVINLDGLSEADARKAVGIDQP